jgi:tetratricopeptide (TPR) repeat protein
MPDDLSDNQVLLGRALGGDCGALAELFERHRGRLDEAIHHCRQALRLNPRFAGAHNILGNALRAKGRLDEAIDHYRQALRLDPKHALAHYNLGIALCTRGRLDEAIGHYQQALRIDPRLPQAHSNLGRARLCHRAWHSGKPC